MTRTMILVALAAGSLGLAIGWFGNGARVQPPPTAQDTSNPSALEAPAPHLHGNSGPARVEFSLRPEDVNNDRETPALAVDAEGRVVLAWASQSAENERTIYLARSNDDGRTFTSPTPFRKVPIYRFTSQGKGKAMAFSTHVLPRLAAAKDGVYLSWVEAIQGGPDVVNYVAHSTDGGATFSEPVPAHGKEASRPGFTMLSATADGALLTAWLDGRHHSQQPFFATKPAGSEGFEPERLVYAGPEGKGICPCCDLAALRLPDGADLVAFRNSEGGFRDIWFAKAARGGAFEPPAPLSTDHWKFEGCPHDGPSLALDGDQIYAVWMSAHEGKNRVYSARSSAKDLAFRPEPLSQSGAAAQGHPKLCVAGPGQHFAVWDESLDEAAPAPSTKEGHGHGHGHASALTGTGRAVKLAVRLADSNGFAQVEAVAPRPGAFQLNPAIALAKDRTPLVAWGEIDGSGKRVVLVRHESRKGHP